LVTVFSPLIMDIRYTYLIRLTKGDNIYES
jgi:hypothetical protein